MRLRIALIVAAGLGAAVFAVIFSAGATGSGTSPAGPACPVSDHNPTNSSRPGATAELVPTGPVSVLLCRYNGLAEAGSPNAFALTAGKLVTDQATATNIASALDALPERSGTYSCPADIGTAIVAFFRYPSGPDNPVSVGLTGCNSVSNGPVSRLALGAPVVGQLESLVSQGAAVRDATIKGFIQLCGGPAPGRCFVSTIGGDEGPGTSETSDRITVRTLGGVLVAQAHLHDARFSVRVPTGRYVVTLLGDGPNVHGQVLQKRTISARAGEVARVRFFFAVP